MRRYGQELFGRPTLGRAEVHEFTRSMHESQDRHDSPFHQVDDAIAPVQDLSDLPFAELGYDPTQEGRTPQSLDGLHQSVDELNRVEGRVACDPVLDFLEVAYGSYRPVDFRHLAIFALTRSWARVRPPATSSRPF